MYSIILVVTIFIFVNIFKSSINTLNTFICIKDIQDPLYLDRHSLQ